MRYPSTIALATAGLLLASSSAFAYNPCESEYLTIFFGTNIADVSKPCHFDDRSGCDIYKAHLTLRTRKPSASPMTVCNPSVSLVTPVATDAYPLWHPDVFIDPSGSAPDAIIANFDYYPTCDEAAEWELTPGGVVGPQFVHDCDNYYNFRTDGTATTWTKQAWMSFDTYVQFGMGPLDWVSDTSVKFFEDAHDPAYLPARFADYSAYDECVAYHGDDGEAGAPTTMFACDEGATWLDHRAHPVPHECTHHAISAQEMTPEWGFRQWAGCTDESGDVQLYQITAAGISAPRWFNPGCPSGKCDPYVDQPLSFYAADYPEVGSTWACNDRHQRFPSFGDTSSLMTYNFECFDNATTTVARSKLYLADSALPTRAAAGDILNVSELIEQWLVAFEGWDPETVRNVDAFTSDFVYGTHY